jgi:hypothetical protein
MYLHEARTDHQKAQERINTARAALEDTDQYKALTAAQDAARGLVDVESAAKDALSELMLAMHKSTGQKDFPCGKVVNTTTVVFNDDDATLSWAIDRKIGLLLDKTTLKTLAKTLPSIDGVTVEEGTATRIKSDLSEVIEVIDESNPDLS